MGEGAKPVALNKTGTLHNGLERLDRTVEPLDMTDLKDSIVNPGNLNQLVRLSEELRNRFLYQDVHPALQELLGNRIVQQSRYRHADRIYLSQNLAVIAIQLNPVPRPQLPQASLVDIDYPDQIGRKQFRIDSGVVLSHIADTHYAYANRSSVIHG